MVEFIIAWPTTRPHMRGFQLSGGSSRSVARRSSSCACASRRFTSSSSSPARIRHPYGGAFKRLLAQWAEEGCN